MPAADDLFEDAVSYVVENEPVGIEELQRDAPAIRIDLYAGDHTD